jgi:hypothetical protein
LTPSIWALYAARADLDAVTQKFFITTTKLGAFRARELCPSPYQNDEQQHFLVFFRKRTHFFLKKEAKNFIQLARWRAASST